MIGCNKVTTKEYIIENSKIPKAFDEYTIVMLSDLHDNPIVDKIIKSVDMISPDIIVCAGDMPVSNVKYMDRQYIAEELMIKLAKQYRILYANGNHETKIKEREYKFGKYYEEYRLKLEDAGIEFINNKKYTIEKNGEHTNDHQLEIAKEFAKEGYIICLDDFSSLGDIIKDLDKFKPKKYKSNNDNFVKLVEDFIDKN